MNKTKEMYQLLKNKSFKNFKTRYIKVNEKYSRTPYKVPYVTSMNHLYWFIPKNLTNSLIHMDFYVVALSTIYNKA